MRRKTALIIVGLQNDYLPGGVVAVPEGDEVIPIINGLMGHADFIVATQEWHPLRHISFFTSHPGKADGDLLVVDGMSVRLTAPHCVQNTFGARLAGGLEKTLIHRIFRTGRDAKVPSESAFYDARRMHVSGLDDYLKGHGVRSIIVTGMPTEGAVKATALTGIDLGYQAALVCDACRGLDRVPGDVESALANIERGGVAIRWATAYGVDRTPRLAHNTNLSPGLGIGSTEEG